MTLTSTGYAGKMLRVDLTDGEIFDEKVDDTTLRMYPGGTCLGAKTLYEEVPPGVNWSDAGNRLFFGSGPLTGTALPGSGTFSVMTKGALTEGAASSQANGWFGAYLKFSGFDAVIIQGAAKKPVYLYIHDGTAELKAADHLVGKTTWETETLIKEELGKPEREASVYTIGPAGENLVRFACIVGDNGHVAAHNGVGAVMGSKGLKAVAVARGKETVKVADPVEVNAVRNELIARARAATEGLYIYQWGTSRAYATYYNIGVLPVKNYTTNIFPEYEKFRGERIRETFKIRRSPCWRCPQHHCHIMEVTEGSYAGFVGEEPEYEAWAAWGSQIGQTDPGAAVMLSNEVDNLGIDTNESGWMVGWAMECFEKGLLTRDDLDGLEMSWGNAEATRNFLRNIAYRRGFGNVAAEGVMRASRLVGGKAAECAIYTMKGSTPRGHDHRAQWAEMLSTCVSSGGTADGWVWLPLGVSPKVVVDVVAGSYGLMQFYDSLGMCRFNLQMLDRDGTYTSRALKAVTGWDITQELGLKTGRRALNLMRVFDIRHGLTAEKETPSIRYGSSPADGPAKGHNIMLHWDMMKGDLYERMGWDRNTGKPLPETLKELGIEHAVNDIWK